MTKYVDPDDLPPEAARPAYIRENCRGIEVNDTIYRIFRTDFLTQDIKDDMITLSCPSAEMHDDKYENALLEKRFKIDGVERKLFRSMMSKYCERPATYTCLDAHG